MLARKIGLCLILLGMLNPAIAAPVHDAAAARKVAIAALKSHWTAPEYAEIMKGRGLDAKLQNGVWEVSSTNGGETTIWISAANGMVLGIRGER